MADPTTGKPNLPDLPPFPPSTEQAAGQKQKRMSFQNAQRSSPLRLPATRPSKSVAGPNVGGAAAANERTSLTSNLPDYSTDSDHHSGKERTYFTADSKSISFWKSYTFQGTAFGWVFSSVLFAYSLTQFPRLTSPATSILCCLAFIGSTISILMTSIHLVGLWKSNPSFTLESSHFIRLYGLIVAFGLLPLVQRSLLFALFHGIHVVPLAYLYIGSKRNEIRYVVSPFDGVL